MCVLSSACMRVQISFGMTSLSIFGVLLERPDLAPAARRIALVLIGSSLLLAIVSVLLFPLFPVPGIGLASLLPVAAAAIACLRPPRTVPPSWPRPEGTLPPLRPASDHGAFSQRPKRFFSVSSQTARYPIPGTGVFPATTRPPSAVTRSRHSSMEGTSM